MADELAQLLMQRELDPSIYEKLEPIRDHWRESRKNPQWWYNTPKETKDGLPIVPPPSQFQPDPIVVGPPEAGRMVQRLLDLDPYTKQNVKRVDFGPNLASMLEVGRSNLPMHSFASTDLGGIYSPNTKGVGINPRFDPRINESADADRSMMNILVHELTHASGAGEPGAEQAEKLLPTKQSAPTEADIATYFGNLKARYETPR